MNRNAARKRMPSETQPAWKRFWLPVILALICHAALGVGAARRLTATHDEYWHLPAGLLNLETGRFHFDNLNPPLCRAMAAVPLLFTSVQTGPVDVSRDAMGWGDAFRAANPSNQHYDALFALGRTMVVLLSVLAGLVTAIWARELFGDRAGCLAALLWAFEPNLIAHGSLVTTDMGATAFFVFTLFALWRFALAPGWKMALLFGVVLGLAQLAKFTSLILYPIVIVDFVVVVFFKRTAVDSPTGPPEKRGISKCFTLWAAALVVSLLVLNAGYLFRGSCSSLKSYKFQSATLRDLADRLRMIQSAPIPLPRDYVEGIDHQRQVMEQKHPVFLDGQWSVNGFPHYYLWAMFYKLPHALQLLALAVLLWIVVPGKIDRRLFVQVFLLVPAAAMLATAETSRMQLGIRYVLPAVPFLILFASQAARWFDFKTAPLRSATTLVLAIGMILSVRFHPGHLAYFNELAGGPIGGREHLLDSNLDWGQDLGGLKRYLDQQGIGEIGLAYFGTVPPSSFGIDYHIPPPRQPQPGSYAISVNFEQGRPHWVRTPPNRNDAGEIRPVDVGEFSYFAFFRPRARIGYSIDVFDLSERDVAEWRAAMRNALRD